MSVPSTNVLQNALLANGTFSGISGYALMVFASPLNNFMGVDAYTGETVFLILGILLAFYSLCLYIVALQPQISGKWVCAAIALDAVWVLGSIVILGLGLPELTKPGQGLIAFVAFIVGILALAQWVGLRKITLVGQGELS